MKSFYLNIKERLIEITEEVADAIRSAPYEIEEKGDVKNIVTTNDIISQRMLVERLSTLIPGSQFFCEEEGLQCTDGEFVWIIDPIDGTTNYSRGIPECAISVALLHNGETVVGVVRSILDSEVYAVGFPKGSELTAKVNEAIKTLFENKKIDELAKKYGFENVVQLVEKIED